MVASDKDFADRWRAAVTRLKLQAERLQAMADDIPPDLTPGGSGLPRPDPHGLLRRHQVAVADHMTALACLQAILRERDT